MKKLMERWNKLAEKETEENVRKKNFVICNLHGIFKLNWQCAKIKEIKERNEKVLLLSESAFRVESILSSEMGYLQYTITVHIH